MSRAPLLLCLAASAAFATPIPARLVYDASGTSCPGKDALVSAVTRRLGTNPFDTTAASTLMVQVNVVPKGLTATVVRMKPDGTGAGKRELSNANTDCKELFKLIELEVTLAVDPLAKVDLPPPPPPPETAAVPAAPAPVAPAPAAAPKTLKYVIGDGPSDTPTNRMTRTALFAERARLEENRPNGGLPFIIGGAGATGGGLILTVLSLVYANNIFGGPQWVLTTIGGAAAVIGVGLMAFGVFRRLMNIERIEMFGMRLNEIDTQLEALERSGWTDPGPPAPMPARAIRPASALR